jgi:hypothetical protein
MNKMYCSYCESQIFEEDRTCSQCGAPTKNFFVSLVKEISKNIEEITQGTITKVMSLCAFPLNIKGINNKVYAFQELGETKNVSKEEALFIKENHKHFLNAGYCKIIDYAS